MQNTNKTGATILGGFIFLGLAVMGYFLSSAAIEFKMFERSVTVKGLAERELPADIVIWPIQFTVASNDLGELYDAIDAQSTKIRAFLTANGVDASEVSLSAPSITDKLAQQYGNNARAEFRYSAFQNVTVYSEKVLPVRELMGKLSQLGKQGIVFSGENYQSQTQYLFTRLNDIKPGMVEEATTNAREVAAKFAADSKSSLGKIKRASQGQFSINDRDQNNPHIKTVRVVSTVEYYLSD